LEYTNDRFLQQKPVQYPVEDAGKRHILPRTPKEKPTYFNTKNESEKMGQSYRQLVTMMEY